MDHDRVFEPAPTLLPGMTLAQVLETYDLTPSELAARAGLSTREVNGILDGTVPITEEFTARIEKALQVSEGFRSSHENQFMLGAEPTSIDPVR